MQKEIRSFVGSEAARKAQCQCVGIEEMPRLLNCLGRRASGGVMPGQALASVVNQRLAGVCSKLPELGVRDAANVLLKGFRRPQPAIFSTEIGRASCRERV